MADKSAIEWTDATWNPIVGCSVLSPGCTNCYAMKMAARIERMHEGQTHYAGTTQSSKAGAVWTGKMALAPDATLTAPLRWKRGRRIFVNSMGDLFHESIPDEWIDRVFAVMALCPQHTFQVLTKRAERMRAYCASDDTLGRVLSLTNSWLQGDGKIEVQHKPDGLGGIVLPNVWLGVSTERQQEADERIPLLLQTPATVRFISAEPLLGPINLMATDDWLLGGSNAGTVLDWVIVGGESGHDARPMHPDWPRSLRDQCEVAGVKFFFKQWGEYRNGSDFKPGAIVVMDDGRTCEFGSAQLVDMDREKAVPPTNPTLMLRVGKKAAGRLLDGREHNEFPSVPA